LGNASGRVLTTTAYAIGDVKTPARYAIYRVVASAVFAIALMRVLGVMGVVLGAVIAAWVESVALGWKLRQQIGGLGLERIPFVRIALLGAASVGPALAVRWAMPAALATRALGAFAVLGVFGVSFVIAAPLLKLLDLRSLLRRKGTK